MDLTCFWISKTKDRKPYIATVYEYDMLSLYFEMVSRNTVCCHHRHKYTVSQKNDNDVLRCNFNAHQPILIVFGRDIAE